ncbi:MAG: NAD-dependent epimerase/dehydratase family protein [Mycobacteriales bacterium]
MAAPARTILVTGVSRDLGSRLAASLAERSSVRRVIGVDAVAPTGAALKTLGRAEFVRADIRHPRIAALMSSAGVDTIVHLNVSATPGLSGGRSSMKEMNVLGTMQLLAAAQQTEGLRRLVLKSTTAVYGSSKRDPALFTEDTEPTATPRSGYGKDAVEIEGYVRAFGRRRPDVAVTVLRFANFIGPRTTSPMVSYLSLPVVPTILGFDPRLQFVHEDDSLEVLRMSVRGNRSGVFNVAGDGILLLSQAIRRSGRVPVPVPPPVISVLARFARSTGLVDFSPEQMAFLNFGRVVDTSRLQNEFGYRPRHTTASAFADFASRLSAPLPAERVEHAERLLLDRMAGLVGHG